MSTVEKNIDELGRVVIPKKFREKLGIGPKGKVLVALEKERVIIYSSERRCVLCGEKVEREAKFRICLPCVEKIKSDS